jgi:hypothetical protein
MPNSLCEGNLSINFEKLASGPNTSLTTEECGKYYFSKYVGPGLGQHGQKASFMGLIEWEVGPSQLYCRAI